MTSVIVLKYKRDVDKSTGKIELQGSGAPQVLHVFERTEFSPMLTLFAEALIKHPEADAIIQRTDRDGLVPYNLERKTTDLFRTDPIAAITAMASPFGSPSTAVQRVKQEQEERTSPSGGLRVGYAILADGFGDELYARFDNERLKVECPCCGIWANTVGKHFKMECLNPKCSIFTKHVEFGSPTDKWATFKTADLLAMHSLRYYFPRTWNVGSWISWADLNDKYEQYKKEKASCP